MVKGLLGHEGWIRSIHAMGSTLYTGSQDETIRYQGYERREKDGETVKTKEKRESKQKKKKLMLNVLYRLWDLNSTECFQVIQAKGTFSLPLLPLSSPSLSLLPSDIYCRSCTVTDANTPMSIQCGWRLH